MVHVAFAISGRKSIDLLGFLGSAKCGQGDHLGFTAGEKTGTMRARADANLAPDGADLGELAAVWAFVLVQDAGANNALVGFFKCFLVRSDLLSVFRVGVFNDRRCHAGR